MKENRGKVVLFIPALVLILGAAGVGAYVLVSSRRAEEAPRISATAGTGTPTAVLVAPAGWLTSADRLTVAKNATDLTAEAPNGPYVRAKVGGASVPLGEAELDEYLQQQARPPGEPEAITLDGYEGIEIRMTSALTQPGDPAPVELRFRYLALAREQGSRLSSSRPGGPTCYRRSRPRSSKPPT